MSRDLASSCPEERGFHMTSMPCDQTRSVSVADDLFNIFRARVPGTDEVLPVITVSTVSDGELSARLERGEFSFDAIDEFATSFWFIDKASFKVAFSFARQIAKGKVLPSYVQVGQLQELYRGDVPLNVTFLPSAHHISAEAA
jgi:hypothetical protein